MQAGRRGGHSSRCMREDRLITRFVILIARSPEIRRQRKNASRVNVDVIVEPELKEGVA